MRTLLLVTIASTLVARTACADPVAEKYLQTGQLAKGEQVLEAALVATPADDQLRFGLAVVQLVRGVERLGQGLYEFGCRSENTNAPFLRLPLPKNPDPSAITFADYRRMLDMFRMDLETVEKTLAGIGDREVSLPIHVADIRLNLTGKPEGSDQFIEILKKLMGPAFLLPANNPRFLVCFDRGDVAWLRAYCHVLMALIDIQLAFDAESQFDLWADQQFAVLKHPFTGTRRERSKKQEESLRLVRVTEPARLRHFRQHVLRICELNRETWRFIRAERDNDHEWLPNTGQTGVLGLPVNDVMIDAWLGMIGEMESLFDGKTIFSPFVVSFVSSQQTTKGFNLKAFLDDPPSEIQWEKVRDEGVSEKYLDDTLPYVNLGTFSRVGRAFDNPLAVGYVAWFN